MSDVRTNAKWLRQGSAALVGRHFVCAVAIFMIAAKFSGYDVAWAGSVHVVAVTKISEPLTFEAVSVTNAPPNIEVSILSAVSAVDARPVSIITFLGQRNGAFWKPCVLDNYVVAKSLATERKIIEPFIGAEFAAQNPRNILSRQIASVHECNIASDALLSTTLIGAEWKNAKRYYPKISALKDFSVARLVSDTDATNNREDNRRASQDEREYIERKGIIGDPIISRLTYSIGFCGVLATIWGIIIFWVLR